MPRCYRRIGVGWAEGGAGCGPLACSAADVMFFGYTALRFTCAQIMHEGDAVGRTVMAAIARELHLAPERRGVRA